VIPDATVATVALCEDAGIDPRLLAHLLLHFGSPEHVLEQLPGDLSQVPQLSAEQSERIVAVAAKLEEVRERLRALAARGIRVLAVVDSEYPASLRGIATPPSCLYLKGSLPESTSRVAVIGATDVSAEGIGNAVAVGKELARLGVVSVSGLTGGTSGGVHLGSLTGGGSTCAVVGAGLDGIHTPEEESLTAQIVAAGCLMSEFAPATRPSRGRSEAATRIMVGLSVAVVLIEPAAGKGSMIALAGAALRDGKPVFAMSRGSSVATDELYRIGVYPLPAAEGLEAALRLV
jgi:DNA processing protein